jgi:UDP-N-acetylglucosamine diphosphorylase/glucosamine-1-phosphate N-acetyltransferase
VTKRPAGGTTSAATHLVVFEDSRWRQLRPLTDLLPVPALRFGASDLLGRWRDSTGLPLAAIEARRVTLSAWRDAPAVEPAAANSSATALVVNAAALPGPWLEEASAESGPVLWRSGERIAGARLPNARLARGLGRGEEFEAFLAELDLPSVEVAPAWIAYPWDVIEHNAGAIREDLAQLEPLRAGEVHRTAVLESPERIAIEAGAKIGPLAVLDARDGPIRIGRGAEVMAHTLVTGPCVVGAGTQLYGGSIGYSTIGPVCRIAGEVDSSVWQGYANKRHHGFVGHSVIGEWVNLGALTTTSDLKNNYGVVRVWVDGVERDSGQRKVGAFVGAHARTGIGTLLPTGASVGVAANLFGGGRFAPKEVPPFAWWDGARLEEHRLDKFLETARVATSRRDRPLTPQEETALRALFEDTLGTRRTAAASAGPPRAS